MLYNNVETSTQPTSPNRNNLHRYCDYTGYMRMRLIFNTIAIAILTCAYIGYNLYYNAKAVKTLYADRNNGPHLRGAASCSIMSFVSPVCE